MTYKERIAKKEHTCKKCNTTIKIGEKYNEFTENVGVFVKERFHLKCKGLPEPDAYLELHEGDWLSGDPYEGTEYG